MALFGSREKNGKRGTPGAQYNRADRGVTARPADAYQEEAPQAQQKQQPKQQPELTPEQTFHQKLMERGLSQISLEYKGLGIIILHEIDKGKKPQRIEKVIERWYNLPDEMRFDVLGYPRHFYCYDKQTGEIKMDVELPEEYANLAQKEQDEKVREFMAELTGKQPAAPAAGTLTAELLNATSTEALVDLFYNMKREDRQRVLDAAHKAQKKRQQEANQRRQSGSGDSGSEGGEGKKPQQPTPRPQPVRQPPAPQATGLGATRRRRGG